jgi:ribulose-5-phosphate 4-epimerase/fuculose-1-phosphate aldolase
MRAAPGRAWLSAVLCAAFAMPAFAQRSTTTPEQEDIARKADLVLANRILVNQGVLDAFGHVSVRSATDQNRYYISRSLAPALVSADDIMEYDLDDRAIDARGRVSYQERFIHSEIYRARPDVQAVVHSHSAAVIPFSVSDVPLRPVYHMGSFLLRAVPVFEIRAAGGNETDMLVRNPSLGAALAKRLGSGAVALMRGHGDVVVGSSVRQAVFRAIYTEANARLQSEALRLGANVTYLNEMEAANAAATNDRQLDRPWEIWKRQALQTMENTP